VALPVRSSNPAGVNCRKTGPGTARRHLSPNEIAAGHFLLPFPRRTHIFTQVGEYSDTSLDAAFFALSHRSRRRLLLQLSDRAEARVTELARRHRMSLNSVSKHIAVLERTRLVRRRVVGRDHFIRIESGRLEQAENWLRHHRRFWTARLDNLAALFEKEQKEKRR
jgi:DNA-binding transcriptional ArsR family regulator